MRYPRVLFCLPSLLGVCLLPACEKITVDAVAVADVVVAPSEGSLLPGAILQLTADAVDATGKPLPDRAVSWSSDDESIVTVDPDGRARAHRPGTVRVWASIEGQEAFATIVVRAARIEVSETSIEFQAPADGPEGLSRTLHITGEGLTELEVRVAYPQGAADGWLEARLDGPDAPATVTLTVRTGGLGPGTYPAVLRIVAPAAENSPRLLAVSLRIARAGGGGDSEDEEENESEDGGEGEEEEQDDEKEDDGGNGGGDGRKGGDGDDRGGDNRKRGGDHDGDDEDDDEDDDDRDDDHDDDDDGDDDDRDHHEIADTCLLRDQDLEGDLRLMPANGASSKASA